MDGRASGQTGGRADERKDRWAGGGGDGRKEGRTDGWENGRDQGVSISLVYWRAPVVRVRILGAGKEPMLGLRDSVGSGMPTHRAD
eukprot:SAG22_NODE_474_length_10034_cov_21.356517_6_plen_86_part_00